MLLDELLYPGMVAGLTVAYYVIEPLATDRTYIAVMAGLWAVTGAFLVTYWPVALACYIVALMLTYLFLKDNPELVKHKFEIIKVRMHDARRRT